MIAKATFDAEVVAEAADVLDYDPSEAELEAADMVASVVGKALAENGNRIDPDWDVEIGILARVILYEENRQQLIDHWEHLQRMKQTSGSRRR